MNLYFQKFSDSDTLPSLLILHGLFGSSHNWRHIAKQFASDFQVYSIDLRNHGRSEHRDAMSYPIMANDIKEFMQTHQLQSAIVLGHSMGGKIAMQLALDEPERVSKLIVVDIAPSHYLPRHHSVFEAIDKINQTTITSRQHADELIINELPEEDIRLFLLTNLSRMPEGHYDWHINMHAIQNHYQEISAAISNVLNRSFNKPSLFIRGELSDYIKDSDLIEIKKLFPKASIETIAQAGHWLQVQRPIEFLEAVKHFLNN